MAISNFSELKAAIANWTHRSDLTSVIPDFISIAEARFNRDIRHPKMMSRATADMTDGWVSIPSDFVELIHLEVEGNRLQKVAYTVLDDTYADNTDTPDAFAMVDEQFRIAPYTAGDSVEIVYYATITALSDSNTSNWLLTSHPDLYLHASLAEAFNYLKEPNQVAQYNSLADRAIREINRDGARRRFGEHGAELRTEFPHARRSFDINKGY